MISYKPFSLERIDDKEEESPQQNSLPRTTRKKQTTDTKHDEKCPFCDRRRHCFVKAYVATMDGTYSYIFLFPIWFFSPANENDTFRTDVTAKPTLFLKILTSCTTFIPKNFVCYVCDYDHPSQQELFYLYISSKNGLKIYHAYFYLP